VGYIASYGRLNVNEKFEKIWNGLYPPPKIINNLNTTEENTSQQF
jgi:hypothetical protein